MAERTNCSECGEGGAQDRVIRFTGGDVITARVHETCAAAIVRRADEWSASLEGRIAAAERAGQQPCNRCATLVEIQLWDVTDANGTDVARACVTCAVKAQREHPDTIITAHPTDEQLAELARWQRNGWGTN